MCIRIRFLRVYFYIIFDPEPQNQLILLNLDVYIWINKLPIDVWFVMIGQYLVEI